MSNVLEDSLFVSQNKKFDEIQSIVRQFSAEYVGNSIIKDNIFAVIQNYARKKEIALELLRYPIHDDELWALTFLKQDTIFVCVNTALPLCKQFFAAAHELYHIYCYVENADQSYIKNGSMLDSATGDETGRTQEDLEANAFAGLLLMPDQLLHEQILSAGQCAVRNGSAFIPDEAVAGNGSTSNADRRICDFYDSAGGWQRGCVFGTGGSNDSASMVHIRR